MATLRFMSSAVEVQTVSYRAVFREPSSLTLRSAAARIESLESLIYTAGIIDALGPRIRRLAEEDDVRRAVSLLVRQEPQWMVVRNHIRVQRISYNSPLEVIFTISAGVTVSTGTFYLAASRAVALYDKFLDLRLKHQDLRMKWAEADLRELEASKFVAEQLGVDTLAVFEDGRRKGRRVGTYSRRTGDRDLRPRSIPWRLASGADSLGRLEKLHKVDE
jgi:hypothetical protein